jgi:hypothetical protein
MSTQQTQRTLSDLAYSALLVLLFAANAGAVSLPTLIDLNVTPGAESTPVLRIYGDNANDQLGNEQSGAIAFGDINGDGHDDVIVGARYHTGPGGTSSGVVYIVYGSASLPATQVDLNNAAGSAGETRIYGDDTFDGLGVTVASGDINGDNFDDVIIGASGGDQAGRPDCGEVIIIYGSGSKPGTATGTGSVVNLNATVGARAETRIYGDDISDALGWGVATGDINGDGYDDVLMGAAFGDNANGTNTGETYIVYGSATKPGIATGSGSVVDLGAAVGTYGETRILGASGSGYLGLGVASSDVNGDGYDDFICGAYGVAGPGGTQSGALYVLYGGSSKPGAAVGTGSLVDLSTTAGTNGETRIYGDDVSGIFGGQVSTGDINGDGYGDIVAGAFNAGPTLGDAVGEGYVLYGRNGKPGTPAGSGSTIDLNDAPGTNGETRIIGEAILESFGYNFSAGDVNGDGVDDIIATVPYPQFGAALGKVNVIYGSSSKPGTALLAGSIIELATDTPDVTLVAANISDRLGYGAASAADVDRDGYSEFATTAPFADTVAGADAGQGIVVFGDGLAASATATEQHHAGDTQTIGIGGRLSPVVRAQVRYVGGTASRTDATITRSSTGITNLGAPAEVADVYWNLATNRTGYSFASLKLQYLDSEIVGMDESKLQIFRAGSPAGPWTKVGGAFLNTVSNEIYVGVGALGYFALSTIDVTGPSATSIVPNTTGPTNADTVSFTLTFDESVEGFDDASDLIVNLSGITADAIVTGSDADYTVTVESIDGDGTLSIAVDTNAEIKDVVGNFILASVTSAVVTIDNTAPNVTLSSSAGDPVGGAIAISVEASEVAMGLTDSDFEVTNASITSFSGSGSDYTFNLTPIASGSFGVSLKSGQFTDPAGNGNNESNAITRNFDPNLPSVTSITPDVASPTNSDEIDFTVTFDEPVTGFDSAADLIINHVGTNHVAESISGGPQVYNVTLSGVAGDGTITLAVNTASGIADLALNPLASSITSDAVTIDNTAPGIALSSATPDPHNGDIGIEITATEPIVGLDATELQTDNAAVSGFAGNDDTYTAVLTPTFDGAVSASIPASAYTDIAGNPGGASNVLSRTHDASAPMFTGIVCTPQDATVGDLVQVTFSSSEPVLGDPDVFINGNAATRNAKADFLYEYVVLPGDLPGPATLDISGLDAAGNVGLYSGTNDLNIQEETAQVPLPAWPLCLVLAAAGAIALRRRNP